MPRLSPSASRTAWPSTIATSSTVWWASTSVSPCGADGEVDERVLGEREQHVVVERHAGADLAAAGAVEVDGHLDGALGRRPAHRGGAGGCGAAHGRAPVRWVWREVGDGLEEPGGLLRSPGRDTKIVGNAHVADEDAPIEQRRPRRVRVGEPPEEHEVGVARHRLEAQPGEAGDDPVALVLDDARPSRASGRRARARRARPPGSGSRGGTASAPGAARRRARGRRRGSRAGRRRARTPCSSCG